MVSANIMPEVAGQAGERLQGAASIGDSTPKDSRDDQVVWTATADGVMEDLPTWRAFTGQRADQVREWGWLEAVHPDDRASARQAWERAIVTGRPYTATYRLRRHDGAYRHVAAHGLPAIDAQGQVGKWVGTCRDITEAQHLEREREAARARELAARETARQLDVFLLAANQEFRTALSLIVAALPLAQHYVECAMSAVAQASPVGAALAKVQDVLEAEQIGALRLSGLLDNLLQLARLQNDLPVGPLRHCDLLFVVRQAVTERRRAGRTRRVRLHLGRRRYVRVAVDSRYIGQVLANYLSNACKYAAEDRPVDVCVQVTRTMARVAVRDQGQGIPAAEQARIWECFCQIPSSEPDVASGRGLGVGLYICRRIIEHYGGQVGVQSVVGQGSTFWFTLPLAGTDETQ